MINKKDSVICERYSTIQEGHNAQSCFCENPYLMNIYESKETNEKELKELLKNKANKKKWMFQCPCCNREVSFYTENPSMPFCPFCEEGALMVHYVDQLECIDLIHHCMDTLHLTQSQIGKKLKASRSLVADVLRRKANLNYEQYKRLDSLYETFVNAYPCGKAG